MEGDIVRLPRGYWGPDRTRAILDKVLTTRYEVDLGGLSPGEHAALAELVAAGRALQDLAEDTEHHQALRARRRLHELHDRLGRPPATADLLELYAFSQGPIATTLDNELLPFLPVDPYAHGRNVYPWAITADEIETVLAKRPDRRAWILDSHTAVRRTTAAALKRDLATLRRYPVLAGLHPGLVDYLQAVAATPQRDALYAVPYSVAWPDAILDIAGYLHRAAAAVGDEDPDLAAFLRLRSRDLLADDNEAGDAAWVRGTFNQLDVVVGAHETYDDELFGTKAFFGLAILLREPTGTAELRDRMPYLQAIEDALPINRHRTVASEIPVGSFDVIAAFGQGTGPIAEILPNDPALIRKYGRKILLRHNFQVAPGPFEQVAARWRAAMAPVHHGELTPEGLFRQTTWHEVGHYLGPDTDRSGRPLDTALGEDAAILEELKSELVSAFACRWLGEAGAFSPGEVTAVVAACILGGLRPVRPLRAQPFPTLWLMLLNHHLEAGALRINADGIHIDHATMPRAVENLLREALAIQDHGTRTESNAFIERYSTWDQRHEQIAARIRAAERYRTLRARFAILDAPDPTTLRAGTRPPSTKEPRRVS
jgi:hypothetical protein